MDAEGQYVLDGKSRISMIQVIGIKKKFHDIFIDLSEKHRIEA
jgi:hypothetical protein